MGAVIHEADHAATTIDRRPDSGRMTLESLDIYHALEKLSDCGKELFTLESPKLDSWRETTKRILLKEGYDGFHVLGEKKKSGETEETKLAASASSDGYQPWQRERSEYRQPLAEGRSIGSGQVEGACKNLIGARFKQTGPRRRVDRIDRMGVIRSLFNGDQNGTPTGRPPIDCLQKLARPPPFFMEEIRLVPFGSLVYNAATALGKSPEDWMPNPFQGRKLCQVIFTI